MNNIKTVLQKMFGIFSKKNNKRILYKSCSHDFGYKQLMASHKRKMEISTTPETIEFHKKMWEMLNEYAEETKNDIIYE